MATKLLKELHREARRERGRLLRWVHSFCGYAHKRSRAQGPVEQIGAVLKTVALLGEPHVSCVKHVTIVVRWHFLNDNSGIFRHVWDCSNIVFCCSDEQRGLGNEGF